MVIDLKEEDIKAIIKHFGTVENLHVYRIIVNHKKNALLFTNCEIGELFNPGTGTDKSTSSLVIEVEKEFDVNE